MEDIERCLVVVALALAACRCASCNLRSSRRCRTVMDGILQGGGGSALTVWDTQTVHKQTETKLWSGRGGFWLPNTFRHIHPAWLGKDKLINCYLMVQSNCIDSILYSGATLRGQLSVLNLSTGSNIAPCWYLGFSLKMFPHWAPLIFDSKNKILPLKYWC